jgi:KDO2-lipid IV(A) lauroyltransferase
LEDVDDDNPPAGLRFRYWMETTFLRALAVVVALFPRSALLGLADRLGWLAYYVLKQDRKVADANAELVFGDTKSAAEKKRIARMGTRVLARNLAGLFWASRLNHDNFRRYVDVDEPSWQWFRQVQARGGGVIFITPHYGDWEMGALAAGFLGAPFKMVTEAFKNPDAEALLSRLRSVSGHTTVPPRHAVVKLFKALKRGETVGILVDVNGRRGRGGVWLDFFGLPVFNAAAVADLAVRTGASIVFAVGHPIADFRTRLVFGPEVELVHTGDAQRDSIATNQRCLDLCADLVRQNPDHWLWTYKRWKRRPTPEIGRYPYYSKYDENTEGRSPRGAASAATPAAKPSATPAATMATVTSPAADSLPA